MSKFFLMFTIILLFVFISCEDTVFGTSTWKYEITGTATSVRITMNNRNEETIQQTVDVPWSTTFERDNIYTFFAYISAQNQSRSGNVTVKIYRNDKVVDNASTSVEFGIATASYYYN